MVISPQKQSLPQPLPHHHLSAPPPGVAPPWAAEKKKKKKEKKKKKKTTTASVGRSMLCDAQTDDVLLPFSIPLLLLVVVVVVVSIASVVLLGPRLTQWTETREWRWWWWPRVNTCLLH